MLNWLKYDATEVSVERSAKTMGLPEDITGQTQTLLDLAAKGDEQAYDKLIARASERLLRLTRRMLRN